MSACWTFLAWIVSLKDGCAVMSWRYSSQSAMLRLRPITTNAAAARTRDTIHATFTIVWCRMLQTAHLEAMNLSLQTMYILLVLNQLLVHL